MRRLLPMLFAISCAVGFTQAAHAAVFDFEFLASGQSVAQGSFSFPDADLSETFVDASEFTSFDLIAGGSTFTPSDVFWGEYAPTTNSFAFNNWPDGFGYVLESFPGDGGAGTRIFVGDAFTSPCYTEGLCGPQYPPVFLGYNFSAGAPGETSVSATFDTIVITPDMVPIPESGTAALLGTALAGFDLLARFWPRSQAGRIGLFWRLQSVPPTARSGPALRAAPAYR